MVLPFAFPRYSARNAERHHPPPQRQRHTTTHTLYQTGQDRVPTERANRPGSCADRADERSDMVRHVGHNRCKEHAMPTTCTVQIHGETGYTMPVLYNIGRAAHWRAGELVACGALARWRRPDTSRK